MRVVVIPDIHLKPWIFDEADAILKNGEADRAVCLMDIADDWNMAYQIGAYEETYDRAIAFAKAHPDTLWCYGNHDVSYLWGFLESGYSPYAENTVCSKLAKLQESLIDPARLAFVHRIDRVLFCHGGLSREFVEDFDPYLLEAEMDEVLEAVNDAGPERLWKDDSPLWLRPQDGGWTAFRGEEYVQVVGHTPVKEITLENGFISTDVFSTYPRGGQIGESAMVVIETTTGEFEKK